jgi:MoaA/NifB/PqqE/SkfB family radical SAM enzyme
VGRYLYELHLYNWGEPLLNRNLIEMVKYAKRFNDPKVIVSSNLSGMSDRWAEQVMHSGIDLLNISIDGATQRTYEKYRVGGNFDQVLGTLRYMAKIKKTSGLKKPLLRWQFIPMKHNENEIESARRLAVNAGVDFRIHRVRLNVCDFDKKDNQHISTEREDWLPGNSKYVRLEKNKGLENVCSFLWDRVVFNWDGSLVPCCKIYTREDVFAEDLGVGFMNIWNGSAYVKAREIFAGKRTDEDFICQRCVDHGGSF